MNHILVSNIRRSLTDQVAEVLGRRIVQATYRPGEILPAVEELLAEFSVSRTVLREAMKILESKGLVETRQKLGTRVRGPKHWAMLDRDVLRWQVDARQPDMELVRALIEVRRIVEPAASELAAQRAASDEVAAMRQALESMAKALEADDQEAYIEADMRFHNGILVASHNFLLLQMDAALSSALRLTRDVTTKVPHSSSEALPLHAALVDRIDAGKPAAARKAAERLLDRTEVDVAVALKAARSIE